MPTRPLPKWYHKEDKIEVPPPLGDSEQLAEEPESTHCKLKYLYVQGKIYLKFNIFKLFCNSSLSLILAPPPETPTKHKLKRKIGNLRMALH